MTGSRRLTHFNDLQSTSNQTQPEKKRDSAMNDSRSRCKDIGPKNPHQAKVQSSISIFALSIWPLLLNNWFRLISFDPVTRDVNSKLIQWNSHIQWNLSRMVVCQLSWVGLRRRRHLLHLSVIVNIFERGEDEGVGNSAFYTHWSMSVYFFVSMHGLRRLVI